MTMEQDTDAASGASAEAPTVVVDNVFDIFLIHTGKQKNTEIETMKTLFELPPQQHSNSSAGFRCFLDRNMKKSTDPNSTMERALENCRHAVVVLSKDFLSRPSPCAELQYAFSKMQWLRQRHLWNSMWVVLLDLSVEEYKAVYKATGQKLPPLHHDIQMYVYDLGRRKYESWPQLCWAMMEEIRQHDENEQAKRQWEDFVQQGGSLSPTKEEYLDFPRAKQIYEIPREETGCCDQDFFSKSPGSGDKVGPRGSSSGGRATNSGNQQQHYLVAAAVIEDLDPGGPPFAENRLPLVLTLPVDGQTQNVQFDFDLQRDDPVQVAKDMALELGLPHDAVLEVSETISGLALSARMKQEAYNSNNKSDAKPLKQPSSPTQPSSRQEASLQSAPKKRGWRFWRK